MLVCDACGPGRGAHKGEPVGGKRRRTRVCRKCGAVLDRKA